MPDKITPIKVKASIKKNLKLWGTSGDLQLLSSFQAYVFEFQNPKFKHLILRVIRDSDKNKDQIESEIHWVKYLFESGLSVSEPVAMTNGEMIHSLKIEGELFHIYVYRRVKGFSFNIKHHWHENYFKSLGKTIGKLHHATMKYRPPKNIKKRLVWHQFDHFKNASSYLLKEDRIAHEELSTIMKWAKKLPIESNSFGVVHGDLHDGNYLLGPNLKISLFDFDDSCRHFLAYDLALPIYYHRKKCRQNKLKFTPFENIYFEEYLKHYSLPDYWLNSIDSFIRFRRMEMYIWYHKMHFKPGKMDAKTKIWFKQMQLELSAPLEPLDLNFIPRTKLSSEEKIEKKPDSVKISLSPHERNCMSLSPINFTKTIDNLKNKGFVLLEKFYNPKMIDKTRIHLEKFYLNKTFKNLEKDNYKIGDKRLLLSFVMEKELNNLYYYAHPCIQKIMSELLGENFILGGVGSVLSFPGSKMQHIHIDHPHLFNSDKLNAKTPPFAIQVNVPLIDYNKNLGPYAFWEGTHNLPSASKKLKDLRKTKSLEEAKLITPKMGDIYLTDYRLIHCGLPNNSKQIRPMLYFVYFLPWFRDISNYDKVSAIKMNPNEFQKLPEQVSSLFKYYRPI